MALHGGRAGRLHRELVLEKQIAVEAEGGIDDIFGYNGPTQMVTRILHKPEFSSEATLAAFDAVIREVQENGISEDELQQLKVKWRSDYYSTLEGGRGGYMPRYGLMHLLACFTLFDGEPQLVNTILDGFLAVTREDVLAAAKKYLRNDKRAIVFRKPVNVAARRLLNVARPASFEEQSPSDVPALSAERAVTWPKQTKTRFPTGLTWFSPRPTPFPNFMANFSSAPESRCSQSRPGARRHDRHRRAHRNRKTCQPPDRRRSSPHRRRSLHQRRTG